MSLGYHGPPACCPPAALEAARNCTPCTLLLGTSAFPLEVKELVIGNSQYSDFVEAKLADGKVASFNVRHVIAVIQKEGKK